MTTVEGQPMSVKQHEVLGLTARGRIIPLMRVTARHDGVVAVQVGSGTAICNGAQARNMAKAILAALDHLGHEREMFLVEESVS